MSFDNVESFDDFVVKSKDIDDDDLLVVVSSRRAAVSFESDMDAMPEFLHRYFSNTNLIVLYPSQFGTEAPMTMAETMATDMAATPSSIYLWAMHILRYLSGKGRK